MATEATDTKGEVSQIDSTAQRDVEVEATPEADREVEQTRDKREGRKEATALRDREPGKSILPFSRVQRIIKADKASPVSATRSLQRTSDCRTRVQELPMVARDATFLISLATEEFIKRLSQACQRIAEREKRTTVQQKDVGRISLFCVL